MAFVKSYWENKEPISATRSEKERLLEYEIDMFRKTCNRLNTNLALIPIFDRNLLLESLALHTRILVEFFYDNKQDKYPNDFRAKDLLENNVDWQRPELSETLAEAEKKADKLLAHLSLWRLKLERDKKKDWKEYPDIKKDLEKVIETFRNASGISISIKK